MIHLIVSSLCLIIILLILYIIYLKKYVYISFLDKLDSFSDPNDLNHIINSIKNNTDEFNKIKQDKNVIIWICNLIDSIPIISNYNLYSLGKKLLKKIPFIGHNKKFIVLHHKYSEKKISIVLFSFLKDLSIILPVKSSFTGGSNFLIFGYAGSFFNPATPIIFSFNS